MLLSSFLFVLVKLNLHTHSTWIGRRSFDDCLWSWRTPTSGQNVPTEFMQPFDAFKKGFHNWHKLFFSLFGFFQFFIINRCRRRNDRNRLLTPFESFFCFKAHPLTVDRTLHSFLRTKPARPFFLSLLLLLLSCVEQFSLDWVDTIASISISFFGHFSFSLSKRDRSFCTAFEAALGASLHCIGRKSDQPSAPSNAD